MGWVTITNTKTGEITFAAGDAIERAEIEAKRNGLPSDRAKAMASHKARQLRDGETNE